MPRKSSNSAIVIQDSETPTRFEAAVGTIEARDRRLNFGDRWNYAPAPELAQV
jgi:hypothetical protein